MNKINADIDIDINDRHELLKHVPHIIAQDKKGNRHQTGLYFQKVPFDQNKNISNISAKTAQEEGYFKIDFLNLSLYNEVASNDQLLELIEQKTDWSLLEDKNVVNNLLHISGYYSELQKFGVSSIDDMAIFLAMIRPAKKHLFGKDKKHIKAHIWDKPKNNEYYYKKSHAFSYAMVIKVQLNLITYKNKYHRVLDLIGDNTK